MVLKLQTGSIKRTCWLLSPASLHPESPPVRPDPVRTPLQLHMTAPRRNPGPVPVPPRPGTSRRSRTSSSLLGRETLTFSTRLRRKTRSDGWMKGLLPPPHHLLFLHRSPWQRTKREAEEFEERLWVCFRAEKNAWSAEMWHHKRSSLVFSVRAGRPPGGTRIWSQTQPLVRFSRRKKRSSSPTRSFNSCSYRVLMSLKIIESMNLEMISSKKVWNLSLKMCAEFSFFKLI